MSVAALPRPSVLPALRGARAEVEPAGAVALSAVAEEELGPAREQVAALEAQAAAVRLALLAEAERRRVAEGCNGGAATGTDAWAAGLTGDRREVMRGGLLLAGELRSTYHHTRETLAAGRINVTQVRIIVEACRQAPEEATPQQRADAGASMVAKATGEATRSGRPMSPRRLRQAVRRMFDPIDRDLADRHEAIMLGRQRRRADAECFLQLGDNGDGSWSGRFRIPELHGRLLTQALQRLSAPRRLSRTPAGEPVADETVPALGTSEVHGQAFCELLEHLPTDGHAANGATLLVTIDLQHLLQQLPDHLLPGPVEVGTGRLDLGVRIGAGGGCTPRRSARHWPPSTRPARRRGASVPSPGARSTTHTPGHSAGAPTWPTPCRCAATTTARPTTPTGACADIPMAAGASTGARRPTGGQSTDRRAHRRTSWRRGGWGTDPCARGRMATMADEQHGLIFPSDAEGRRSTTALGRAVVADALRGVDAVGARAAERETAWRSEYLLYFRRLVEAGLGSPDDALGIARAGLDSFHGRMRVRVADLETDDGHPPRPADAAAGSGEVPLAEWPDTTAAFDQVETTGSTERVEELVLPYRGDRLRGDAIRRRVDGWVQAGVVEPSVAEAVGQVLDHPEWLRLEGHTIAVVGAGSEMGPLQALTRWGARVAAVDLPRKDVWDRVLDTARAGAGTVVAPTAGGRPGADLLADVPALTAWLAEQPGTLVLGNYVYADGATNVRVSTAVDELSRRLLAARDDVALAFLATPTDVFAVPREAVDQATRSYEGRSRAAKALGRPLRAASGGRLLRRPYAAGSDPGLNDSLVPQQGPNYALAKRLQRWRATLARHEGATVSMHVAPPTRTRSVVKNRALAAAYAGAHRFGVEVFEPATSNVLMAALLVHDLHTGGGPRHDHPWQDEAYAAAHGGLWRAPYAPRSALGLAALLGVGAARG